MAIRWHGFCPLGDKCSRRGRQILSKLDRAQVVHGVAMHLNNSPYHYMDWDEALQAADNEDPLALGK